MPYFPDPQTFRQLAKGHTLVPVYRQLTGDTLTPVTAFCKVQEGEWAFLFESVVGGEKVGRYSFLGSGPFHKFQAFGNRVLEQDWNQPATEKTVDDPLAYLEEKLKKYQAPQVAGLPRFCGGAVGFAGYDAVRYSEKLPHPPTDDRSLPDLCFAFYDRMVIFDHISKTIAAVAHAHVGEDGDINHAYEVACRRVDALVERLQQNVADLQLTDIKTQGEVAKVWRSNFAEGEYEHAVVKCQEYIKAGDAFQVVLSQRLQAETSARPFDIYRALRVVNPSPFMFLLRMPNLHLVGASPEIMVRVENGEVTLRPLAGTRKRGKTEEEDKALAAELLADPKEKAEHVMLVDLGRNDVGRVCKYGSVAISEVLSVERYSHVMHLSSTVKGELDPAHTIIGAMRAALPAGTLSGAPKVRAMEIIDELEPTRRGPYGGAVGYIDFSGNLDTCIALRTLVIKGQTAYAQAGAGIVYDSVPSCEYQETMNKAMTLLRAVEIAERQL